APIPEGAGVGRLVLVTVRPNGALWLIAVLENPEPRQYTFAAAANRTPMRDVSNLRSALGLDGEDATGAEKPPRALTADQLVLLLGADATPHVDDGTRGRRKQIRSAHIVVGARFMRNGLELPAVLGTLFERAFADLAIVDAMDALGIDLRNSAYDVVGEGFEADEEDEPDPVKRALVSRFLGFATNGGGDVYGAVANPSTGEMCVLHFSHEDETFAFAGSSVDEFLARHFRDAAEHVPAGDPSATIVRVALGRPAASSWPNVDAPLATPSWVSALLGE
ncbi:MAG TPA: hypothetical protein VF407_18635, partial [Polyangiaceae bacterium]